MGASDSKVLDKNSTALDVLEWYGTGRYLEGKTAIVTGNIRYHIYLLVLLIYCGYNIGGNSGIGLETCKALAHGGARVILCSRSTSAALKAIDEEIKVDGHGGYVADTSNIVVKQLDLNSLRSVKTFAEDILATEERIDFLVCNAGIMALPNLEFTEDGFEKQIGVNVFGHFYLCQLLLPKMKAQPFESRIVVLSSSAHNMGPVVPTDLHFKNGRRYNNWVAYGQSKLGDLLLAKSLADKLKGTKMSAVSVHPGVIQTNLWKSSFFSGGVGAAILGAFVSNKTIPQVR